MRCDALVVGGRPGITVFSNLGEDTAKINRENQS
jgi:hypothetical protein